MSIEKLNELADKKWDFEAAVRKVNDETKVIKYDNIPSEIYLKVTNIAEELGVIREKRRPHSVSYDIEVSSLSSGWALVDYQQN